MFEYLELPDWEGTTVSKGPAIDPNREKPKRTTDPLPVGGAIPPKDALAKRAEEADPEVVALREKKEREALARQEKKRAAGEGTSKAQGKKKKQRRQFVEHISSGEPIDNPDPLNQIRPEDVQETDVNINAEQGVPNIAAEDGGGNAVNEGMGDNAAGGGEQLQQMHTLPVDEGGQTPQVNSARHSSEGFSAHHSHGRRRIDKINLDSDEATDVFIPNWALRDDVRINSYRSCKELIDNLPTPAEQEALEQMNNIELTRRAYEEFGKSVIAQGELLKRFNGMSAEYWELTQTHQGCLGLADRLAVAESENERLSDELKKLETEHQASVDKAKNLEDEVDRVTREREEWRETSAAQAERIRKLESELSAKNQSLKSLTVEKGNLAAEVAQAEVVKQNAVRTLLPGAVRRLFNSVEYKKSMAKVYSLTYQAGFVTGASVGRKEEEIVEALKGIANVNRDAPKLWKAEFNNLFKAEYPYIKKLADSYRLPLGDLLNMEPDAPPRKDPAGPSSQPPVITTPISTPATENPAADT